MEEQLKDLMTRVSPEMLRSAAWALAAVGVLAILYVVWRVARGRARKPPPISGYPPIDVEALGDAGPPANPPVLEFYHLPVRLAAIVLAPAGRAHTLPPPEQFPELLDALVPGLGQVFLKHRAIVRLWPMQLSPRGFAHAFFAHARLPGDGGKDTPWCSAAGVFKYHGQPVMAGLVMRTEAPTSLGQTIIEQDTKWLDVLRIRRSL